MRLTTTAIAACLAAALAPAAAADDVHLVNGKVFEDVVAEVRGDTVRVHLAWGVISLPASRVDRIEREETALERYRAAKRALVARGGATADDWLALADEARSAGFAPGFRDAALAAARLDPASPRVAERMREIGYALDETLGEWVPREEALRRRGLVEFRGEWVPVEQRDRVVAEEESLRRERAESARIDRLTDTVQALAELELVRALGRAREPQPGLIYPVYSVPFFVHPRRDHPRHDRPHPPPPEPEPPRAPSPGETNRGGMESSFGGNLGPPELIPGRLNPDAAPPPGRIVSSGR